MSAALATIGAATTGHFMDVLVVDVGGTHVKILATRHSDKREFASGPKMTAEQMVSGVRQLADGWSYDVVSIGYPGPVLHDRPVSDPKNLGPGWVGFDFKTEFGRPTKVLNDAAMQAVGSYKKATYEDYVGARGLDRLGKKRWRKHVFDVVDRLVAALEPDDVVLGGGNAKMLKELPPTCRLGDNTNAFRGGFLIWRDTPRSGKSLSVAFDPAVAAKSRAKVRPERS